MKLLRKWALIAAFAVPAAGFTGCDTPYYITGSAGYSIPSWAPPHYNGARYYYFPDNELYYDLSDGVFVYLHNGQWLFSPVLPSLYAGFDLYNAFIITLNIYVYQPWMHHQYYVSHYPRYYYHNIYPGDLARIRGFNENGKKPLYWQDGERERIKDLRKNEKSVPRADPPKPPQKTNYYGKPIGEPVKVKPHMKIAEKVKQLKKKGGS